MQLSYRVYFCRSFMSQNLILDWQIMIYPWIFRDSDVVQCMKPFILLHQLRTLGRSGLLLVLKYMLAPASLII